MQISFEYSGFWLLLILPLSGLIAWWVYWHNRGYDDWSKALKGLLTGLRVATFFILGFLLLQPFLISLFNDVEKPLLLVYNDVSQSVNESERGKASTLVKENLGAFEEKYDVKFLDFGETVVPENDSAIDVSFLTDYQVVVQSINQDYYNLNIGAVLIATDGIQTFGADPRFLSLESGAPLFMLALGDSSVLPDIELTEVLNNRLAFLGNEFQLKARFRATRLGDKKAVVRLMNGTTELAKQEVNINSNDFAKEIVFQTKATKVGLNRFSIAIDVLDEEVNKLNNSIEAFVDVLDNRTRVLLLAKSPHPDIAALKAAVVSNDQYEIEVKLLDDWNESSIDYDLTILHGLPTSANDLNRIKVFRDQQIPVFSILTPEVSLIHLKQMDLGLEIQSQRSNVDESGAMVNSNFSLFKAPTNEGIDRLPPLNVPFGEYRQTDDGQALLLQKIGSIETDKPLLLFSNKTGWKRAVLAGEGWWRWRLYDRMMNDGVWADAVIVKTVQYLALKQKRTRLNVAAPERISEGKEVKFEAEYYNESFELDNEADLRLVVTDSLDHDFEYRFQNDGRGYKIAIGTLSPGDYTWKATAQNGQEQFSESGEFIVTENKAEFLNLRADFNMLEQWSMKTKGQTFYAGQEAEAVNNLLALETAKPIIHSSKEWQSIIEWKWVAFLIVLLIAAEWFLRKYNGHY